MKSSLVLNISAVSGIFEILILLVSRATTSVLGMNIALILSARLSLIFITKVHVEYNPVSTNAYIVLIAPFVRLAVL